MEGEKTVVLGKSTVLFIVEYSRHWYGGSGGVERAFFSCPGYPVPRSAPETYSNPYPVVSISLRELGGAFKVTSQCFNWQSKLEAEFCMSVTWSASGWKLQTPRSHSGTPSSPHGQNLVLLAAMESQNVSHTIHYDRHLCKEGLGGLPSEESSTQK